MDIPPRNSSYEDYNRGLMKLALAPTKLATRRARDPLQKKLNDTLWRLMDRRIHVLADFSSDGFSRIEQPERRTVSEIRGRVRKKARGSREGIVKSNMAIAGSSKTFNDSSIKINDGLEGK